MTILEVHNMFRSLAQQQGMQTIRAILPENIDICVNNQIINKVRNVVMGNTATTFNDRVSVQNNPISPINAIRNLYERNKITTFTGDGSRNNPFSFSTINSNHIMYYTNFFIGYDNENYDCRIVEGDVLNDTLNDYCNAASMEAPVADLRFDTDSIVVDIHTGKVSPKPNFIGIRYIRMPARVKYSTIPGESIDPDIQDYLIPEIVSAAVNEYLSSIGATSHTPN